jgi:hypothetical protein
MLTKQSKEEMYQDKRDYSSASCLLNKVIQIRNATALTNAGEQRTSLIRVALTLD